MKNGSTILLVEDDRSLSDAVAQYLRGEGFTVRVIDDGNDAVRAITMDMPELVILDVMLPGKDGLSICREIRAEYPGYIIMYTAREDEIDQIVGLELGADDYLIKPVKPRLLLAKIKACLRRSDMAVATVETSREIRLGELLVDLGQRTVALECRDISLTAAEFDLLAILAEHAGKVLTRDFIMRQLSGGRYDGLDRTIDNKISILRRKLSDDMGVPSRIKTVRSKGYVLVPGAWKSTAETSVVSD